jgi:peptide/nickel transport system substrate-binding protein
MALKRLLLAGLVAALAVAPWATPSAEAAAKNTVTYAMYGDVKDWDPSVAFSLEVMMLVNVYEPLLWYNPPGSDTQFTPALATDWSVSDDGLAWTFKLREGVSFHDGEPFNAAAAKAALERTISMKKGAWYIWASVDAIEAPDDTTLIIKTKGPQPIDLIASSQYGAYIFSPKAAEMGTDWFNEGNAAGTGPYQVRQWAKGQQVVLEKFDGYWGGWSDKNFDRVILKPVTENATQVQMLKAGEADFISLVPADLVANLNQEEGINSYAIPSWKNSMYLINTQKYPTDNLKVRQALTHLWDYETVVRDIYAGHAEVGRGVVPATMWGHNGAIQPPKFDPDLARKLLEESGVPEADWKVSMAYIGTSEEYKNSALLLQENARQVGLEIELLPGEWGVIWDRAKNLDTAPNLQSMTWWPTYPTPNDWMIGLYHTEESALFNLSHYSNPEYDKILDSGVAMEGPDRAKAIEAYHQAQQILMDDAVAIFYADIKTRVARRADIEGLEVNPAYNAVFFHRIHRK